MWVCHPHRLGDISALPIVQGTKAALPAKKSIKMSPIQQERLFYSLCGLDLIDDAETGTGKTLAFVSPTIGPI
jgi:superfamily II DNA/RNA helicase